MAHKFKYGFKAEAERYAEEYRAELNKKPWDPLCPRELAEHLGIPIFGIKNSRCLPEDIVLHWANHPNGAFSGLIISDGCYKEIHHNDFCHPRRQNSDLAHELAHIILGHDMDVPIKENGERAYDRNVEQEAKWLGAALLLPKRAVLSMVLDSYSRSQVEDEFQVSWDLYQYRVRVTDAVKAARNTRNKFDR